MNLQNPLMKHYLLIIFLLITCSAYSQEAIVHFNSVSYRVAAAHTAALKLFVGKYYSCIPGDIKTPLEIIFNLYDPPACRKSYIFIGINYRNKPGFSCTQEFYA